MKITVSSICCFSLLWGGFFISLEWAIGFSAFVFFALYGVKKYFRYSDFWHICVYRSFFKNRGVYNIHEKDSRLRSFEHRRHFK
ncbi:MAG: hypothetical protein R6W70_02045 [bacterium]